MSIDRQNALSDIDFESFKRKVHAAYGLDLNAYKRPQMERRLRSTMSRCGAQTFQQYYALIQSDAKLRDEFLDRVTINVSELFRNPDQFESLRTQILPELLARRSSISIWSAGCSYGAEPYSLAISLDELAPSSRHTILATDIDSKMLDRARKGLFTEAEMRNVSKQRMDRYFDHQSDGYAAKPVIKNRIVFRKHNLLEDGFGARYDLILCRNVVIYFTEETKAELYKKFYDSLAPGGYLFVGGTERIANYSATGFEVTLPFFYKKSEQH